MHQAPLAVLLATALVSSACGHKEENRAEPQPTPAAADVQQRDAAPAPPKAIELPPHKMRATVEHSCPAPPQEDSCQPPPAWLTELDGASAGLLHGTHGVPWREQCDRAERALKAGLTHDPNTLSTRARILAQSLALAVIASRGCSKKPRPATEVPAHQMAWSYNPPSWTGSGPDRDTFAPRKLAARLVAHVALDSKTLEALGSRSTDEVDHWVGARATWRDRTSRVVPLNHEAVEEFTRRFRPVRTATRRAIFSQLVAVDRDWKPHITPLVGRIELRLGLDDEAPGCAVKLKAARIDCEMQLSPAKPQGLAPNMFVAFHTPTRLGCKSCHSATSGQAGGTFDGDLTDLDSGARGKAHLAERERKFMARATGLAKRAQRLAAD